MSSFIKKVFPYVTLLNFWPFCTAGLYPTSLANLVVEVESRHSHQILLTLVHTLYLVVEVESRYSHHILLVHTLYPVKYIAHPCAYDAKFTVDQTCSIGLSVDQHLSSHSPVNSCPPGQNGRQFSRRHFQMHFLEWKCMNFTEIYSQETNWH